MAMNLPTQRLRGETPYCFTALLWVSSRTCQQQRVDDIAVIKEKRAIALYVSHHLHKVASFLFTELHLCQCLANRHTSDLETDDDS